MACAGGVVLLALLRLGGYLLAWDGGPDQMLVPCEAGPGGPAHGPSQPDGAQHGGGSAAGRPGPAAPGRKVLGAAYWPSSSWLSRPRSSRCLAIIGYTYSALSLAGIEQFIPMALNTAVVLALMSGGILCARPDRGVMAVVSSAGAGGVMARRLLPAVIFIPPVVGWVCWLGRQQGALDQVMGLSLFVLTNIVIFTALIWWNAASLDRMDGERRRAERRLGFQYTATRVLAESPRLDDAVPRILQAICESLGWDVGVMWWVDPQASVLVCGDLWHSPSLRADEFAALCRREYVRPRHRSARPRLGERTSPPGSPTSPRTQTSRGRRSRPARGCMVRLASRSWLAATSWASWRSSAARSSSLTRNCSGCWPPSAARSASS